MCGPEMHEASSSELNSHICFLVSMVFSNICDYRRLRSPVGASIRSSAGFERMSISSIPFDIDPYLDERCHYHEVAIAPVCTVHLVSAILQPGNMSAFFVYLCKIVDLQ